MHRHAHVHERHRPSRRLDLHVDITVAFHHLADMQRHVDDVIHMPIRTIAVKTRISEALVARGLGPVFLR